MTIGPEPRIRMRWMSSLRGMPSDPRLRRVEEAVEEVEAVVRAGARLGVVLDRGRGDVEQRQPLGRAVVEVDVRQLGGPEVGLPAHGLRTVEALGAAGRAD